MIKRTILIAFFALTALALGSAQKPLVTVKAGKTQADNGKQMFTSYCAPCHGVDGKGQGPVAPELVMKPTDLTLLSRNNNGKFPGNHVAAVLEFGQQVKAHGVKDMPVWGPALAHMDGMSRLRSMQVLRIRNLEDYVKSIQAQ